jgi:hypothetical protein
VGIPTLPTGLGFPIFTEKSFALLKLHCMLWKEEGRICQDGRSSMLFLSDEPELQSELTEAEQQETLRVQILNLLKTGPASVEAIQRKITAPLREIVGVIAELMVESHIQPKTATDLAFLGVRKCEFQLVAP